MGRHTATGQLSAAAYDRRMLDAQFNQPLNSFVLQAGGSMAWGMITSPLTLFTEGFPHYWERSRQYARGEIAFDEWAWSIETVTLHAYAAYGTLKIGEGAVRSVQAARASAAFSRRWAAFIEDYPPITKAAPPGTLSRLIARNGVRFADYEMPYTVLEDVRYSAARRGGKEGVILLEEAGNNPYPTIVYEAELTQGIDYPRSGLTQGQKVNLRKYHNRVANSYLYEDMQSDPFFLQQMMQEYPDIVNWLEQTRGPRGGFRNSSPPGWTWHHASDPGRLWLISELEHDRIFYGFLHPVGNKGGVALWGIIE